MRTRIKAFFCALSMGADLVSEVCYTLVRQNCKPLSGLCFNKTVSTRTLKKVQWSKKLLFFLFQYHQRFFLIFCLFLAFFHGCFRRLILFFGPNMKPTLKTSDVPRTPNAVFVHIAIVVHRMRTVVQFGHYTGKLLGVIPAIPTKSTHRIGTRTGYDMLRKIKKKRHGMARRIRAVTISVKAFPFAAGKKMVRFR